MRIRTIKPEFWSHPVMVRQDDSTKLLALGLLNYADDEGYFFAEPSMVRAALRPLDEDSSIVRASFDLLIKIGYLVTFLHQTHGLLGRVVNFTSHQKVDRPKDSVIRVLWGKRSSTNNRRIIDDGSSQKRRCMGTGNREQGTGKAMRESFELFWAAYPKKKAKSDAWRAFEKVTLPLAELLIAIAAAKESFDWTKENGQFIPHPASWLNGKRWEDEMIVSGKPQVKPMLSAADVYGGNS